MVLTAMDLNTIGQFAKRLGSCSTYAYGVTACLDLVEILVRLLDTPRVVGVASDASQIVFGCE